MKEKVGLRVFTLGTKWAFEVYHNADVIYASKESWLRREDAIIRGQIFLEDSGWTSYWTAVEEVKSGG